MNNKEIQQRLDRAVNEAPIGLFQAIQDAPIRKMEKHDSITGQGKSKIHPGFLQPLTLGISFVLIFAVGFTGWYHYFLSPDSYIYLDVNPGIEIVTNRQNQVINLVGINEEGKELVGSVEYRREGIDEVLKRILDKMTEEGLLEDARQVMLVSAFNKDQAKSEEVLREFDQGIHEYLENEDLQLVVLRQVIDRSNTLEEFAGNYHITIGKLTFIRNLMILNPDFQLEDLVDLRLEELLMLSLQTGLELDRIIDSDDDYEEFRLPDIDEEPEPQPKPEPEPEPEPSPSPARLSMYEVKEIARREIGGGIVVELEYDSGDREYEITIQYNGYEYEIEMDAYTGRIKEIVIEELDDDEIISEEHHTTELIGINRTGEIALDRVGGGSIEKIKLDEEDGRLVYEVEVEYKGRGYDLEIDAYTGQILSSEIDH